MNAAIDIGNTQCKIGFFENDVLQSITGGIRLSEVAPLLSAKNPSRVIISSVGVDVSQLVEELSLFCTVAVLTHKLSLPLTLDYHSKETLGTDRIAGVAGALHLYPQKNCLVIDVGTCITYDVITADAVYVGGAISPGVDLKLKSMHTFTARLPLIDKPEWTDLPGKDTRTSMVNGVLYGTLAEMEGMIDRFSKQFADLHVLLCGGGSNFFESKLKHHIFVRSELVLIGLNSILRHNEKI